MTREKHGARLETKAGAAIYSPAGAIIHDPEGGIYALDPTEGNFD